MASPGSRHCVNCIGTLSFAVLLQLCTVVSSPAMTGDERVSECVDLYSAQSLRIPNAPDALVTREQVRFK